MAMEIGPFISDFPIKSSIDRGFSIAMFDYQRVCIFCHFNDELFDDIITAYHNDYHISYNDHARQLQTPRLTLYLPSGKDCYIANY